MRRLLAVALALAVSGCLATGTIETLGDDPCGLKPHVDDTGVLSPNRPLGLKKDESLTLQTVGEGFARISLQLCEYVLIDFEVKSKDTNAFLSTYGPVRGWDAILIHKPKDIHGQARVERGIVRIDEHEIGRTVEALEPAYHRGAMDLTIATVRTLEIRIRTHDLHTSAGPIKHFSPPLLVRMEPLPEGTGLLPVAPTTQVLQETPNARIQKVTTWKANQDTPYNGLLALRSRTMHTDAAFPPGAAIGESTDILTLKSHTEPRKYDERRSAIRLGLPDPPPVHWLLDTYAGSSFILGREVRETDVDTRSITHDLVLIYIPL